MIYLDTSFFVALVRRRERRHDEAAHIWRAVSASSLVTSTGVVGEIWTLLRRRDSHADAVRAVATIHESRRVSVVHASEALVEEAWAWLRRHDEHPYSFVDSLSFAIMRRQRITEALAFDDDFTRAGFVERRLG
jgi:uncharacterized protein